MLAGIGPQSPSDSPLMARVRFHQSWFRHNVLKLPEFGCTRGGRPIGSILTASDGENGKNFVTPEAHALFRTRHQEGWGVDPVNCTRHMTASQALTLNLIAPLLSHQTWFARLLSEVLRLPVNVVNDVAIEYAPPNRSQYLGDQTRVDAWIQLETSLGPQAVVLEVKYADRFNSRHVKILSNERYRVLGAATGLWDLDNPTVDDRIVNQLLRCHALGAAVWRAKGSNLEVPKLLVIHHRDDEGATRAVGAYSEVLNHAEAFAATDLSSFLETMRATADSKLQRDIADQLWTRYAAYDLSEQAWQQHRHVGPRKPQS